MIKLKISVFQTWHPCPSLESIFPFYAVDLPLPQYTPEIDPVVSTVDVTADKAFVVETVYLFVRLKHRARGDLKITLISPSGTSSVVHPGKRPEDANGIRWKFVTNKAWGESPSGTWTLLIEDEKEDYYDDYYEDDYYADDFNTQNSGNGDRKPNINGRHLAERIRNWSIEVYGRVVAAHTDAPTTVPTADLQTKSPTIAPSQSPKDGTRAPTTSMMRMAKGIGKGNGAVGMGFRGDYTSRISKGAMNVFKKTMKTTPAKKTPGKRKSVQKMNVMRKKSVKNKMKMKAMVAKKISPSTRSTTH